jgi:radical SAM superfamily enzyme YgiQ (UPF0313 family)
MNALLVYPQTPVTFWSFNHALRFINKKSGLPPLGLLTVASLLPEDWNKRLVDLNVRALEDSDIDWADHVYLGGMIVQKASAREVIRRAKARGKFVVAGGPMFSSAREDFPGVDCFVLNEGESTIPAFLSDLAAGKPGPVYESGERPPMALSPIPDWSLIRTKDYASMPMQISRGCPYNCEFCDIVILNGRVPRVKSPGQVRAELDALLAAGWRGNVFIVDDNFIGNKARVKGILRDIVAWMDEHGRPFNLATEAPIGLADDAELLDLMRGANFNAVFVGIETPNEESLLSCGKNQNTGIDMVEKVKVLQRNGMEVQGGFILGFDTDTPHTFDDMIRFIQSSGIVTAMVGLLHALPETALYKRLMKENRLLDAATGNNTDFIMNFVPTMNPDALMHGYRRVLNNIFSPEQYYARVITYLREYRKVADGIKISLWVQALALARAVWNMGIRERGKRHFWKLLFWTVFKRPTLFPEAITQAIYGYHFRKVLVTR